jgi:hypothetical protein
VLDEPKNENQALKSKKLHTANVEHVANKINEGRLFDFKNTYKLKIVAISATGI